ncbi:hypothetical protein A1O3_01567 [Capronia epimyces CBS 606.96]|uniref:Methyltransferase domain-containing protein n=1 Tax=Capronia epimyces CBS 606.96 TaxID=1182542 RepID=W9YUT1_9EURO|nr:uncharacterized protein A1O3_01567 [Capronia epimyces CBS 606.96]EXJ93011.1 hypothetical protein A1O3_01567 [Capronia epimyces CBS 606.96]
MAQNIQPSNYVQGYSNYTLANHQRRTAETEAAFLVPLIKKTDYILDVGCGPGTITTGLAKYASEGTTIGIDISANVLEKAKTLAAEVNAPTEGPGSVVFKEADVLERLPYPDDTFDVVYAAHVLGHMPMPDLPLRALVEMRRVLKPGGILATRDALQQHFYPASLDLDRLWVRNLGRAIYKGVPGAESPSTNMPILLRKAGFNADAGQVHIGARAVVSAGPEIRKWLAWRATGQLTQGDPFRESWLDAGITEDEIQDTLLAVQKFAETEDAWFLAVHGEMLAWK